MKSASIGIIVLLLVTISLSTIGSTYACFTTVQVTGTHLVSTWQSYVWTQTTQSDFEQGVMVNANTSASPDSVILGNLTTSPSVYGMTGNSGTGFSLYNISNNTWVTTASTPAGVGAGGALAYTNNGNISALRVDGTTSFYQYNISTNTWVVRASTPANVAAGGALTYDGGNYIYALRGGGTASFWRYDIATDTWSDAAVSDPSTPVDWGGGLTYVPGSSQYTSFGTLASQVFDTTFPSARWDRLEWDNEIVSGTDITFQVRASDTLFAMDDSTPVWTAAGWPSPVSSGLPSGRYLQWRARLSTGDTSKTPALNEVRVSYS